MKWLVSVAVLFVGIIIGLSFYLQPSNFYGCGTHPIEGTDCTSADAIVVLSGGDTMARTAAGVSLYLNGWASALVFAGAAQDTSGPSNASAMRQQAIDAGVPRDAIFIDEQSVNTQQNAENVQKILASQHYKDVILVTSGYHQRRAQLELARHAPEVTIKNYPVLTDRDWSVFWWVTPRGWWLAGGEMVKIIALQAGAGS